MDKRAREGRKAGSEITAIVVRYMDGRPARMHDDTDDRGTEDVCIVYPGDTASDAAEWLMAERGFIRWCTKAEAVAELVMVTVPEPAYPGDLEATLQVGAEQANVSYGFVRIAELYAEAG